SGLSRCFRSPARGRHICSQRSGHSSFLKHFGRDLPQGIYRCVAHGNVWVTEKLCQLWNGGSGARSKLLKTRQCQHSHALVCRTSALNQGGNSDVALQVESAQCFSCHGGEVRVVQTAYEQQYRGVCVSAEVPHLAERGQRIKPEHARGSRVGDHRQKG